jgi:hypothetical protein
MMPERLTLDTLFSTIVASFIEWQLKGITQGTKGERDGLISFTNLVYAALGYLQNHPLVGTNTCLTMDYRFAFARRLIQYVYDRSLILVHYDLYDDWKTEWKAIKRRHRERMKQTESDDGGMRGPQFKEARNQQKAETKQLHDHILLQTQLWFASRLEYLTQMTIANPSQWEQAFFIGFFGHEQSRWFQLLDPSYSYYRYHIGPYPITWAFLGHNGRNTAVNIISSPAITDSASIGAERWCRDNGWNLFVFTQEDIAKGLDACVEKVDTGVSWYNGPY